MLCKSFIKFEDTLYLIKKSIKEEHNPNIDAWKELTDSNKVLKKDGVLFFIEEITDLEIISDVVLEIEDSNVVDLTPK